MKNILYSFLILQVFINAQSQDLNEPLLISGQVTLSTGSYINEDDMHLQVYLKDHPSYFLTESSLSCGYAPPVWFIELGNLPIKWHTGDLLTILIEDYRKKEQIRYDWVIDSTGMVPDLKTQVVSLDQEIYNFSLSDRGVIKGIPINFTFNSVFGQLTELKLQVISDQGNIVHQSFQPEMLEANTYQFSWDGRSQQGDFLRSGIYFYFFSINQNVIHSGLISLKND